MEPKRYLIIGASGMVGYCLARRISRGQDKNTVVGTWRSFELETDEFQPVRMDLSDGKAGDFVREFKPEFVYHLASETRVDYCEENPQRVYKPIQVGLFSLIDACNEVGGKLIFISSDGIFGRNEGEHYEDTPPSPVNVYGKSKVLSEGLIRSMCSRWVIVRCCPVGHHPFKEQGLIRSIERKIRNHQEITGWTDCRFSPLSVPSLVERLIKIQTLSNRIIHLYSYPGITKYNFIKRLVEILGGPLELVHPGEMPHLEVSRPKSQVLGSRSKTGRDLAVPIEQEFERIKADFNRNNW